MNWDRIQGNWQQWIGHLQEQWGDLTEDDWAVVSGRHDQLVGKLQERYGIAKEEAERQIVEWQRKVSDVWFNKDPQSD